MGARYCAMITERNKEKRVEWCQEQIRAGDLRLTNVVWTEECTVQLESHCQMTYHQIGEAVDSNHILSTPTRFMFGVGYRQEVPRK